MLHNVPPLARSGPRAARPLAAESPRALNASHVKNAQGQTTIQKSINIMTNRIETRIGVTATAERETDFVREVVVESAVTLEEIVIDHVNAMIGSSTMMNKSIGEAIQR